MVPRRTNTVRRHGCCPGAARRDGRPYIHPVLGSIPSRSTAHYRRFAARSKTSRAHVTGLASSALAARSMASFSLAVSGNFMLAVLRSAGGFGL